LHDRQFGVTFAPDGKLALPTELSAVIERDAAGNAPDHRAVAAQLEAAGLEYKTVIAAAQVLLDRAGSPIKTDNLSAHVLAQLNVFGEHLQRHAASRPK
jgi:hypothetical protein